MKGLFAMIATGLKYSCFFIGGILIGGVFLPIMKCRAYSLGEKVNIWRAKMFLKDKTILIDKLFATDLTVEVPQVEIPVHFISGRYDYTVSRGLSKAYLEQLQAPVKGFYTFEQPAHSPLFEEPEKFVQIMMEDVQTDYCSCRHNTAR